MKLFAKKVAFLLLSGSIIMFFGCGNQDDHDDHAGHDHGDHAEPAVQAAEDTHDDHAGHDHGAGDVDGHDDHDAEAGADLDDDHEGHDHGAENDESMIPTGSEWESIIQLDTATATVRSLDLSLTVPGAIIPNSNQVAVVTPFIESNVNRVFANEGDRVKVNTLLACLASPDIGMMRAEYDKASAELTINRQVFERKKKLFDEKIIPRKDYEEAELGLKIAQVTINYARKSLEATGLRGDEINGKGLCKDDLEGTSIHLYAPIDGVITSRDTHIGQKVNSSNVMFEIMNLKTVWLEASVFEKDISKIKTDQQVRVKVAAYEYIFRGKIFNIGNTLDEATRTIRILVEIDNPAELLKPGMYASTDIVIGETPEALVVPSKAVLSDENLKVVFVKEEGGYHRHAVETGIESGGVIEITHGLKPGDIVVTTGNFQLKSRLKMSTIDPHAGHNH